MSLIQDALGGFTRMNKQGICAKNMNARSKLKKLMIVGRMPCMRREGNPNERGDHMKHCGHCNVDVDNSFNLCPYCGQALPTASVGFSPRPQQGPTAESISFQSAMGGDIVFNGQVVESSTQQYYQSKFTKVIQAVFHREPYQLSHTTFVTVFRIEEYVQRGFAEQARDIVVYGQLQNMLFSGDDVTVVARKEGNRLVAKSIINHSSETQVIPHGGIISAGIVRVAVFIPLAILLVLLIALISTPASVIVDTLLSIFWPILLIWVGVAWLKSKFKRK